MREWAGEEFVQVRLLVDFEDGSEEVCCSTCTDHPMDATGAGKSPVVLRNRSRIAVKRKQLDTVNSGGKYADLGKRFQHPYA